MALEAITICDRCSTRTSNRFPTSEYSGVGWSKLEGGTHSFDLCNKCTDYMVKKISKYQETLNAGDPVGTTVDDVLSDSGKKDK